MSIFELIPLKRGGSGFLIGGFTFGLDKRRDDRSYLKCTEAKTRCKARATIFDGSNFAQINVESHNHLAPNTSQLQTYWSRKLGRSVYTEENSQSPVKEFSEDSEEEIKENCQMNKFLSSIVDSNRHSGSNGSIQSSGRSQNHQQLVRSSATSSTVEWTSDRSTGSPSSTPPGIPRAAPATHLTAPVHIDVGGTIYTSTLQTLTKYPNSRLAQMFNGTLPIILDSLKQHYFIDRDGVTFRHVLNFLRSGRVMLPTDYEEVDLLLMEAQYYQLDQLVAQIQRWRAGKPTPSNRPAPTLHRFPHQKASNIVQHQTLKSNGFAPNLSNLQAKRKRPNPPQPQVLSTTSPLPVSPATSSRKDTPSPTNSPHVKTEEFSGDRVTVRVIHSHPEKVLISGHLTTVEELFPESQNALFNLDISDEYVADLDLFNCCPLLTSHSVLDRLMLHNFTTEERKNVEDADYPDFVITETNLIRN